MNASSWKDFFSIVLIISFAHQTICCKLSYYWNINFKGYKNNPKLSLTYKNSF